MKRFWISAAMAAASFMAASQASATDAPFAAYHQANTSLDFSYTEATGAISASNQTYFTPLALGNDYLTNFTLSGSTSNNVYTNCGDFVFGICGFSGNFQFTAAADYLINGIQYHTGDVFLSGTFSNATLSKTSSNSAAAGETSSGSLVGDITYSSGPPSLFLFLPPSSNALSLSLLTQTAIGNDGVTLTNFTAASSGTFATTPAPAIAGVPEVSTWVMMLIGFGAIGWTVRRRNGIAIAFN